MAERAITKNGHRLHLYITNELYQDIQEWTTTNNITLSEFSREALKYFLHIKHRKIREDQLAETCQVLTKSNNQNFKQKSISADQIG